MPASIVDKATGRGSRRDEREVDSVCPYCGVGCQITYHIRNDKIAFVSGRNGPANENRLCVKGRFGFDYVRNPQRLTKPLIRREGAPKGVDAGIDPGNPLTHFREASWEEALDVAANGLSASATATAARRWRASARPSAERGGLPVPEAGPHRLPHEQRRPLHAPLPRHPRWRR